MGRLNSHGSGLITPYLDVFSMCWFRDSRGQQLADPFMSSVAHGELILTLGSTSLQTAASRRRAFQSLQFGRKRRISIPSTPGRSRGSLAASTSGSLSPASWTSASGGGAPEQVMTRLESRGIVGTSDNRTIALAQTIYPSEDAPTYVP